MVVITYQVQQAMNNDTIEFIRKFGSVKTGIFANGIYTDEKVTGKPVSLTVIKGNNVRVIIVVQIFYIDIQNIIIGAEYH